MKTSQLFILSLLIILCSNACKKDDECTPETTTQGDQLPPATLTGANTMGCLINGEVWLPQRPALFGSGLVYDINFEITPNGGLNLFSYREMPDASISEGLSITCANVVDTGVYTLNDFLYSEYYSTSLNNLYIIDTLSVHFLEITRIDFSEEIISGLFEFDLINVDNSLDTLKIRQGRFDLSS